MQPEGCIASLHLSTRITISVMMHISRFYLGKFFFFFLTCLTLFFEQPSFRYRIGLESFILLVRTIFKFSCVVENNKEKRKTTCSCALHLTSHRHGYKAHYVSLIVDCEQSIQDRSTDLS